MSHNSNFSIDGYEISASFADTVDPSAISRVKQILLSSFISATSISGRMRKLAISAEKRDNNIPCTKEFHQQFHQAVLNAYEQALSQLPQRSQQSSQEQEPPAPEMKM